MGAVCTAADSFQSRTLRGNTTHTRQRDPARFGPQEKGKESEKREPDQTATHREKKRQLEAEG